MHRITSRLAGSGTLVRLANPVYDQFELLFLLFSANRGVVECSLDFCSAPL
jgi:hypothetical protein